MASQPSILIDVGGSPFMENPHIDLWNMDYKLIIYGSQIVIEYRR